MRNTCFKVFTICHETLRNLMTNQIISWLSRDNTQTESMIRFNCYFIYIYMSVLVLEEFEDNKGTIRIGTSKKDRQHNGQKKKKDKRTNNDLQNTTQKTKD